MDWTAVITGILALMGSGGIAAILNYKIDRKIKQNEADVVPSAQWKELYDKSELKMEKQSEKIDALRRELYESQNKLSATEIKFAEANWHRCEVINCAKRRPPRSYAIEEEQPKNEPLKPN